MMTDDDGDEGSIFDDCQLVTCKAKMPTGSELVSGRGAVLCESWILSVAVVFIILLPYATMHAASLSTLSGTVSFGSLLLQVVGGKVFMSMNTSYTYFGVSATAGPEHGQFNNATVAYIPIMV